MSAPPRRRPVPTIGFVRKRRADGTPYLSATASEDIVIPGGATLDLRRVSDGRDAEAAEFALLIIAPVAPFEPSKAEQQRLAAGRLDGSAVRVDARDAAGPEAPWS